MKVDHNPDRTTRKGIMKKSIDIPKCFKCDAVLDISTDFESVGVAELSGSMQTITCSECETAQYVSPSIEWQSWV